MQQSRKIALFASGPVGLKILNVFVEEHFPLACLVVLDKGDDWSEAICIAAPIETVKLAVPRHQAISCRTRETFSNLGIELGILAWWPDLIDHDLRKRATIGFLNLHPSLLPFGRGKDPNFWALRQGDPFGVTIHFIDDHIDSGPIAFQSRLSVSWIDTGASLYARGSEELVSLFRREFATITAGVIPSLPQDAASQLHLRSHIDTASQIDLDQTYKARDLLNLMRARTFSPHGGAWFLQDKDRFEVRIVISEAHDLDDLGLS